MTADYAALLHPQSSRLLLWVDRDQLLDDGLPEDVANSSRLFVQY